MTTEKPCKSCGHKFPSTTDYFYRNGCRPDGLSLRCKSCDNERVQAWRQNHLQYMAAKSRERYYKRKGEQVPEEQDFEQIEMFPDTEEERKPVKLPRCTCGNYHGCIRCRNQERRAAFCENRLPVYMTGTVAAAALNLQAA